MLLFVIHIKKERSALEWLKPWDTRNVFSLPNNALSACFRPYKAFFKGSSQNFKGKEEWDKTLQEIMYLPMSFYTIERYGVES